MIELLLPCGFNTLESSYVKATIDICMLVDYFLAKKCLQPHRRDPASSSFISESQPGGFLHAPPLCGLASSHPSFPAKDIPRKSHETT
jgi:hypothetical protein